jgi:hypothetical protein
MSISLGGLSAFAGFAEDEPPVLIDADVSVASAFPIASLVVSGLLAEDRVSLANLGTGPGQVGFANGIVTVGGAIVGFGGNAGSTFRVDFINASAAQAEAALEALTYQNVSQAPTPNRLLTYTLDDNNILTAPARASIQVSVVGRDDPPIITSPATALFAEHGSRLVVRATATNDDAAPVTWSLSGTDAAQFRVAADGWISFVGDPDFEVPRDANGDNTYEVTLTAADRFLSSSQALRLTVTDQRELPVLRQLDPAAGFVEDAAPRLLDSVVAFGPAGLLGTVGDTLAGASLVVAGLLPEDRVSLLPQGSAPGQIDLVGKTVRFGGVAIGTTAGGEGAAFTVSFNAAATAPAVQALIQRLAYANASDAPTNARTLTIEVVDGKPGRMAGGPVQFTESTGAANPFAGIDVGQESAPALVDLDRNGSLDLVVGAGDGTLRAWLNLPGGLRAMDGVGINPANPFAGIDVGDLATPTFTDLNADGFADLVLGADDGTLHAWLSTPTGFQAMDGAAGRPANPFAGIDVGSSSAPTFVDLNGDGRLDLVVGDASGGLGAWFSTLSGFVAADATSNPFSGTRVADGGAAAPAFLDLDGDGRVEMLRGNGDGRLEVLNWQVFNQDPANAARQGFRTGDPGPFGDIDVGRFAKPALGDLNRDGRPDLVLGNQDGTLRVLLDTTPLPSIRVTVQGVNDAPVVTSPATARVLEGDLGAAYRATATDPDSATLGWTLGGTDAGLFTIAADGTVRFRETPDFEAPRDAGRDNLYDITVIASDGALQSEQAVRITVVDRREPATLDGIGPDRSFLENDVNAAPRLLDADVTFVARDALDGARLVVGGLLAEDRVTLLAQGDGAGQVGLEGAAVRFGGVAVGTLSGGVGTEFSVLFNGAATGAAVEAVIERLAYANVSDTPTATRTLDVAFFDGNADAVGEALRFLPFPAGQDPLAEVSRRGFSAPAFVDLDGDGRLDLVVGAPVVPGDISILAWRATGEAGRPFEAMDGAGGRPPNPFADLPVRGSVVPAFTDLTGDGRPDLVIGWSNNSNALSAWKNTEAGFVPMDGQAGRPVSPLSTISVGLNTVAGFADLDGDGALDLAVGPGTGTALTAWRRTASGFEPMDGAAGRPANPLPDISGLVAPTPGITGLSFPDLDGDGRLDLVVGTRGRGLLVFRDTGDGYVRMDGLEGRPANPLAAVTGMLLVTTAFADLDGDGRLDLVRGGNMGLDAFRGEAPPPAGGTITVTITSDNDAPKGPRTLTLAAMPEDGTRLITAAELLAGWRDPEGGALTVRDLEVISERAGTLSEVEGGWLFRPDANDDTGVVFAFTVSDGTLTATGTARLDLTPVNEAPTGAVTLAIVAGALVADASALADADGLGAVTIQWQRLEGGAWTDIPGALGPALNLVGATVRAEARFTDGGGQAEAVASATIAQFGGGRGEALRGEGGPVILIGRGGDDRLDSGGGAGVLLGNNGRDTLLGGQANDTLDGGRDEDVLEGGAGDDVLIGSFGADLLTGGAGADRFRYGSKWQGGDVIADFTPGEDRFEFRSDAFRRLPEGPLDALSFALDAATARRPQFVYDDATGLLSFDADGTGRAAATPIAVLTGAPTLSAGDIWMF